MGILRIVLTVVFVLVSIALVVLVLMQEGKSAGLGGSQARRRHTGARIRDVPWKGLW